MLLHTLCLTLSADASVTIHRAQKLMYDHSVSLLVKVELMRNPRHSIWWRTISRTDDNPHFVFGVNTITSIVADDIKFIDIAQWSVMHDPETLEIRAHGDSGRVWIRTKSVSVSCTRWSTTQMRSSSCVTRINIFVSMRSSTRMSPVAIAWQVSGGSEREWVDIDWWRRSETRNVMSSRDCEKQMGDFKTIWLWHGWTAWCQTRQKIIDDRKSSRRARRTEHRHTRLVRQDACFRDTSRVCCSSVGGGSLQRRVQNVRNCFMVCDASEENTRWRSSQSNLWRDLLTHKPLVLSLNALVEVIHLMAQTFWRQQGIETEVGKSSTVWRKRQQQNDDVLRLKLRFLLWVASDVPSPWDALRWRRWEPPIKCSGV